MLNKLRNLLRIKPAQFLGVDIGTSEVRMVELSKKGQSYKLENYGKAKISSFQKPVKIFQKNNPLLSEKEIAGALRNIYKESGIKTKEVGFSVPDFCSFFTSLELPEMDKEELPQAIQYQVRPYIPLPLEEVTLDWTIIEGKPSKSRLKILVVVIPNEVIFQYQEIARLADLNLKFLESEVFALARAVAGNEKEKRAIGLIDLGARSTTCTVVEKAVLRTSYTFNIAGNELTEIIAKSLNIDYNKAEELKTKEGVRQENSRKALIPLLDLILEEIKKVFRTFYREEGKEVEKIILAGGLSRMPGLKEYFNVELKKETEIADPFFAIASPPLLREELKRIGPSLAISVGLAMKGLE